LILRDRLPEPDPRRKPSDHPRDDDQAASLCARGSLWLERGHPRGAIECFLRAVEKDPDDARAYAYLGAALEQAGEYDTAVDAYDSGALARARALAPAVESAAAPDAEAVQGVRPDLALRFSVQAGAALAARDGIEHIALPTGRAVECVAGLWLDREDKDGLTRVLLPAFFTVARTLLRADELYRELLERRAVVLERLGRIDEARVHRTEVAACGRAAS
jgi:tetratricopeptide (TPR) repeat protein